MNSLWILEMEERERDSRNVCILERGFHINCFTKSVHKV